MKTITTLLYPRWIVPIEPKNVYLENHAVAIDGNKIVDILPQQQAEERYQAKEIIKLENHVIMPGLVNMHTHSPMTLFRGLADDLTLMDWLQNHIWPVENKWLSDEFVYDGTQLAILEMLRGGTTCFNENFFFIEGIAKAADEAHIRACLGPTVIQFPTAYAKNSEENLTKVIPIFEKWQSHPLITVSIAPHAPYSVDDDTFIKVKQLSEKYNLSIHLHLHETGDEINQGLNQYQLRPIQRMHNLGILTAHTQCVHMTQITDEDIKLLQKTKAHVIHCPKSNLKLASGFCPVKKLQDAGINVAIGTDGAASNNNLDLFSELHTAAILAKAVSGDATALSAANALEMATLNGARALGLADKIGSLKIGKEADIIAIDLSAVNTQPIYNPISHLVYALNSRQVTDVWIAGKHLLAAGKFTQLNANKILAKTQQWQERIFAFDHKAIAA